MRRPEQDDAQDPAGGPLTRRGVIRGGAALAGGASLWGATRATAAPTNGTGPAVVSRTAVTASPARHATPLRGIDVVAVRGRDQEARFGLMFKKLPGYAPPDDLLRALAAEMAEPLPGPGLDNPTVAAGDTFLGQFIDHDMTFDRTPLAEQMADKLALTNFDSPLFDLAAIYGRGPGVDPHLYEPDKRRLKVVRNAEGVDDLPRDANGAAFLGDARNDENLILAQLHLLFVQFHNRLLDSGAASSFADAQRLARWHFQWIIVHEFLPHAVGADVVRRFLPTGTTKVTREYYKPRNPLRPMMPLEYSVAAYRFGHSMIRGAYVMNLRDGAPTVAPIFGAPGNDLRGSRPFPARLRIDWQHFFDVPGRPASPRNQARRIDARLAPPLFSLPSTIVSDLVVSLAERNLLRAKKLGLPSGQAVARAMGVTPLTNAALGLPSAGDAGWGGAAPLWFYILREADLSTSGERLGPVGGRIVAETILGILDSDQTSFLNATKVWKPTAPIAPAAGRFTVGDLVTYVAG